MSPLSLFAVAALAQEPVPEEAPVEGEPTEQDVEEAAREADIFGAPSTDVTAREADLFGAPDDEGDQPQPAGIPELEPTLSDADIAARLAEADKRLTVGGLAYLRVDVGVPDVADLKGSDVTFASPNLLDLFVDARPNDRLRAFVRARATHELTRQPTDIDPITEEELEPTTIVLDQLWMNFDIAHRVFVTAGRQRIKWGAGRLWNPTDFLQPARLDALAFFDERTGVGLVKVHVPARPFNLYVIGDVEGAQAVDEIGAAARLEAVFGLTEVAASYAARKEQPVRLGGEITTGVWLVDFKGELSVQQGVRTPGWEGELDFDALILPTEVDRTTDIWLQALGGAEVGLRLNDEDTLYLGGEYFYNQLGTDRVDLYPWLLFNDQFTFFYVGQHYVGGYALLPGIGRGQPFNDMSWTASAIANLSDGTTALRLDYAVTVHTELSINAYVGTYLGDQGEFKLRVDVPGELVGGDDLLIPATLVSTGLGMQLNF